MTLLSVLVLTSMAMGMEKSSKKSKMVFKI